MYKKLGFMLISSVLLMNSKAQAVYSNNDTYVSKYIKNRKISESFMVPTGLERAVDFWIDIYSKYDVDHIVIHDTDTFIVYDVVDVSDLSDVNDFSQEIKEQIIESRVDVVKNKYRNILNELGHQEPGDIDLKLSGEHAIVYKKFISVKNNRKFIEASRPGRIRAQKGQSSSFRDGIYYSQIYMDDIESIFLENGLPAELARLPYVESYFNPKAVSHRSAAGIWQFMKGTGKEYLKVSKSYDERKDPIISTHAAAKLLKQSFRYLWEDWPLAVTSYNHGRFGMKKAAEAVGSKDLVDIIRNYNSNTFGFASKNFYAEFLAALFIDLNKYDFFGDIAPVDKRPHSSVQLKRAMKVSQISLLLGVDKDEIRMYNPSISFSAVEQDAVLPRGATIRLPGKGVNKTISKTENMRGISGYVKFI